MQRAEPKNAYYDAREARKALFFIQNVCRHPKGKFQGQPLMLEPWQIDNIINPLFGWRDADTHHRKFTSLFFSVPRKNGKSTLCCAIALYLFTVEQANTSPEAVSLATNYEQASIVFEMAKSMVSFSPALDKIIRPMRFQLKLRNSVGGFFKPVTAKGKSQHGLSPSVAVCDEIAQFDYDTGFSLLESIQTGFAERENPLTMYISTVGANRESNLFWTYWQYAEQVKAGKVDDDTLLPAIWAANPDDPWDDPKVWAQANPNIGVSVRIPFLKDLANKARTDLSLQTSFRTYHLNQWVSASDQWIDMRVWDANPKKCDRKPQGRCWAGLDLSAVNDLCSLAVVWEPDEDGLIALQSWSWVPEAALKTSPYSRLYEKWAADEYLILTPGEVFDQDWAKNKVLEIAETHDLQNVGIDRWNSSQIRGHLEDKGIITVGVGQGYASMNAATKVAETFIYQHRLVHGGNPLLAWAVDNTVIKMDPAGNKKPDKASSAGKIDPVVAMLNAMYCMDAELVETGDLFGNAALFANS